MFKSEIRHPIFLLTWTSRPELEDVENLRARVRHASEQIGPECIYIAVIPDGVEPPAPEVREALQEGMDEARTLCRAMHLVVEGSGFRKTAIRLILAGILYESTASARASSRCRVHVHATLEEAMESR